VVILKSPTRLELIGYESKRSELQKRLTYTDEKVDWAYRKLQKNHWLRTKIGAIAFNQRLQELRAQREKCLLFEDESGMWTFSGLRSIFEKEYGDTCKVEYNLPEPKLIPWFHIPVEKSRPYQLEAESALINASKLGPASVSIATGLGKSLIIRNIIKNMGLQTIVMVPSVSIAGQMYDDLLHHFGKAKVGMYGGGKKEFKKLITVSIGASLTRLNPGDEAYQKLSQTQVFVGDEAHLVPCQTLAKVCFGLVNNTPYRYFLTGTLFRNDGLDLLLEAIAGPAVYKMTVQEGVDSGFLAKPVFRMCWTNSNLKDKDGNIFYSSDANEMTRKHLYYNVELNKKAAELVNKSVALMSRPVVILIDELEQLAMLKDHLRFEFKFCHGGVTKENKDSIPVEYHKSNPKELVKDFNDGKFPILIGTSCIGIGTDIRPVKTIVNLRGGKSEVEISQNIGRGTRMAAGKEDFLYIDFGLRDVDMLLKHARERIKIFKSIYPSFSEVSI